MDGPTSRQSIEQQFARAQELGRWLTDDELAAEDEQESLRLAEAQKRKSLRTRLMVLTAVCVVLPPLWPLALALTLYLLFPNTSSRLFLARGRCDPRCAGWSWAVGLAADLAPVNSVLTGSGAG